jgi:hypothetical protein
MQHLRPTHPELDFWVDVRLREGDGKWFTTADFPREPPIDTGEEPKEALHGVLQGLGLDVAACAPRCCPGYGSFATLSSRCR